MMKNDEVAVAIEAACLITNDRVAEERLTGSAETAPRAERFAPRFALRSAHSVQRERRS